MASKTPPSEAVAAWLRDQRWFASKTRRITALAFEAVLPLAGASITVVAVTLDDGTIERYVVALPGGGRVPDGADALSDPEVARRLLDLIGGQRRLAGHGGELRGARAAAWPDDPVEALTVRPLGADQSNTSIAFGERLLMKQFRRLREGTNPEAEITRFLTERTSYRHAPRLAGSIEYHPSSGDPATFAVAQEMVPGAEDGWRWALARLGGLCEEFQSVPDSSSPAAVAERAASMLSALHRLGQRTGELHRALASDGVDPDFAPEPIGDADLRRWVGDIDREVDAARRALGGRLPAEVPSVETSLAALHGTAKIRHHGDFHLGQTLYVAARDDFVLIDFEGEPLRPLEERRRKHAAVRDVAGMRRSLAYAAASVRGTGSERWLRLWEAEAVRAFTRGYRAAGIDGVIAPREDAAFERAVAVFELEKAAYEIVYEANNRPNWIAIPTRGLLSAVAALRAAGEAEAG